MDPIKTIRDNLYNIADKYNVSNENAHIRAISQHIICFLKTQNDIEVFDKCMRIFEYIRYNIETNYVNPGYSLATTHDAVMRLKELSRNDIGTAWAAYLQKHVKYSLPMFDEYLAANVIARSYKYLSNNFEDLTSNTRIIFDTDDLKYNPIVSTPTATSADMDDYDGDEECDCDSFCGLCDTGFCEDDSDASSETDCDAISYYDDRNILAITFSTTLPPTYDEDRDWMEAFYKYKKYNKLYQYMHDHIDTIAYDHESRLKYTTLLMSINRNVYNFASFHPEESPYYKSFTF